MGTRNFVGHRHVLALCKVQCLTVKICDTVHAAVVKFLAFIEV